MLGVKILILAKLMQFSNYKIFRESKVNTFITAASGTITFQCQNKCTVQELLGAPIHVTVTKWMVACAVICLD